jgi:hypothetical protein
MPLYVAQRGPKQHQIKTKYKTGYMCDLWWRQSVKVKHSNYRHGQALRVPGGSRQMAHKGGKIVSPKHRAPFTPRKQDYVSRTRVLPACSAVSQTTAPPRDTSV